MLQDQACAIGTTHNLPASIEVMEHDFFTAQPIKGARAYFMHNVLHDWPDADCLVILRNLIEAMTPGYSKILLLEMVMPESVKGMQPRLAAMDLNMMSHYASLERTEAQWRALLEQVGLTWVGVWKAEGATQGVIECYQPLLEGDVDSTGDADVNTTAAKTKACCPHGDGMMMPVRGLKEKEEAEEEPEEGPEWC